MKRLALLFVGLLVITSPAVFAKGGQHTGEQDMLDVNIEFINASGTTVTDATGTYFKYFGYTFKEDKVYPSQYWGTFPLFFFGEQTGVLVHVTNKGPRAKAKVQVKTESYCLLTDGSSGVELAAPRTIDVEVARGETKTINASFITDFVPGAESGLDRFIVKVLHANQGGGPGNAEPGLIMQKEGVYCPPDFRK